MTPLGTESSYPRPPQSLKNIAIKKPRREPGRDREILSDHRQDDNVAVGVIGNLAR